MGVGQGSFVTGARSTHQGRALQRTGSCRSVPGGHAHLPTALAAPPRHFPGNQLINCMCHSTEDLYQ